MFPAAAFFTEERIVATTCAEVAIGAADIAFREVLGVYSQMLVMSAGRSDSIVPASARPMLEVAARCEAGGRSGTITVGVAAALLRAPKGTSPDSPRYKLAGEIDRARRYLGRCELTLSALLGRREMLFSEIRALGPGAIITLNPLQTPAARVQLCCGGKVLFEGAVMTHRGWNLAALDDFAPAFNLATESKSKAKPAAVLTN